MDFGLKNRIALVTGAGSPVGFGRGISLALAESGCHVIVNDVVEENARKTAAEIEAMGQRAIAIKADVTRTDEVHTMVEKGAGRVRPNRHTGE